MSRSKRLTKTEIRDAIKSFDINVDDKLVQAVFEDTDTKYLITRAYEELRQMVIGQFDSRSLHKTVQLLILARVKADRGLIKERPQCK